jgi:hypothetical protein
MACIARRAVQVRRVYTGVSREIASFCAGAHITVIALVIRGARPATVGVATIAIDRVCVITLLTWVDDPITAADGYAVS